MRNSEPLIIAFHREPIGILPGMANRHGLIAGATGTGKTVTLRVLACALSSFSMRRIFSSTTRPKPWWRRWNRSCV